MRWAVEIQNTSLTSRNLTDLLDALGFTLSVNGNSLALTSHDIDLAENASDAFEIAKKLRDAFTGPAGIDPQFELGGVFDYLNDPARRHVFVEAKSIGLTISVGTPTVGIAPPMGLPADELKAWVLAKNETEYLARLEAQLDRLVPAFVDERAGTVLRYLSEDQTRADQLYKVYELMEEHPGKRTEFQARFGISGDEFVRFQDAVHNPVVTGDWARHAYVKPPTSDNPMSRSEAEAFVRKLASAWLRQLRETPA